MNQFQQALLEFGLGAITSGLAAWIVWAVLHHRHKFDSEIGQGVASLPPKPIVPPPLPTKTSEKPKSHNILSLDQLAESSYTSLADLQQIEQVLLDRRQIILYGPPGTGKSFVAINFASYFVGKEGDFETVVFHPSYSYEDFVEGIRPRAFPGGIDYPVQSGILKRLSQTARDHQDRRYVLIIDEINRGNVAKILGELFLLLEYRDVPVPLLYSGEHFKLPPNVYFIGTMNSADRSIALVDFALRRRFAFFEFPPKIEILRKYFDKNPPEVDRHAVLDLFQNMNKKIESERTLGKTFKIGHSYFMEKALSQNRLDNIWQFKIRPLLEEYYFENPEELKYFDELKTHG